MSISICFDDQAMRPVGGSKADTPLIAPLSAVNLPSRPFKRLLAISPHPAPHLMPVVA